MTELEKCLEIIADLRSENSALLEIILKSKGLIEQESRIEIPEHAKSLGKIPWYMLKRSLQRDTRKPKLSEISGIPDEEISNASESLISAEAVDEVYRQRLSTMRR